MSVAKETVFGQIQSKLNDWKIAIFRTVSEFDEINFVGFVSSKHSQNIFFGLFGVRMWLRWIFDYVRIK